MPQGISHDYPDWDEEITHEVFEMCPRPFELRDIEERVALEEAREVANAIETLSAWVKNLSKLGAIVIHAKGAAFHSWQDSTTIRLSLPDGCLEDFMDQIERYASPNPEEDNLKTLGCDAQGNVTEPGWKP